MFFKEVAYISLAGRWTRLSHATKPRTWATRRLTYRYMVEELPSAIVQEYMTKLQDQCVAKPEPYEDRRGALEPMLVAVALDITGVWMVKNCHCGR